ncbi:VWA domain-containing protein [Nocardioides seonyuensis]|uniref:VWA domain-containing protein n=1 Tax=Nocardioides seonyuensis TaxID=2518371 RepID=UPI00141F5CE1|nr:VWA domain-containing protein [Nocardioides seonyuensis]
MAALLLLVPAMTVVAGVPAHATWGESTPPDVVGVPSGDPGYGKAKLVINKGGDRTSTGVSPLSGARFEFFRTTSNALSGGTSVGTCTTDATGRCGILASLSSSYYDTYFYATELSAPAGWSAPGSWGGSDDPVRYATGAINRYDSASQRTRLLPGTGRTWPDVRTNPQAPTRCGIDISMIFDVSNSIDSSELTTFKAAGRSVIDSLVNTPSRVALHKFATDASTVLGALTPVGDAAGATTVKNAINGLTGPGGNAGGTNWDRGLWQSVNSDYDVALILTDGDPTFWGSPAAGPGDVTTLREVEEAIHSANAIKAGKTQVIAVGIGMSGSDSVKRLNLISDPGSTYTTTWQELGEDLKAIATGACKSKVTIQKKIEDHDGIPKPNSSYANGWSFTGSTSAGTLGSFPATAAVNGQNGFTSADLTVGAGQTPTITISESLKDGWTYRGATCSVDGKPVSVTPGQQAGTFSFTGRSGSVMTCEVTNRKPAPPAYLTLTKRVLDASGATLPASAGEAWTLTATGPGGFSGAGNTAAVTAKSVSPGQTYTLSESTKAGYDNGTTWSCVKTAGPGDLAFTAPDKVTPAAGQEITCKITNQARMADLLVSKTAVPSYERDYDWTLTKTVDTTEQTVEPGATASFGYEVTATASAPQDSGFKVTGTITVQNPNATAISGVTILDAMPNATCTVPGGTSATIAPGAHEFPYSCSLTGGSATAKGTNTAKVTWNKAPYNGTSGTAQATKAYDFASVTPTTTGATATLQDDRYDLNGDDEGTSAVVTLAESPKVFAYTLEHGSAAGECLPFTNTASMTVPGDVDQSASTTVEVCAPVVTPPPTPVTPPVEPPALPVAPPVAPPVPTEVLPAQAFGKAVGKVRTSCQGTVRATLDNASGVRVTYKLRVGKKVHSIKVKSLAKKKFRTSGEARAKVTLKLGKRVLDRIRVPKRCAPPEVLPATGLRGGAAQARSAGVVSLGIRLG